MAELKEITLGKLDEFAPSNQRVAVCAYGPAVYAKAGSYRGEDMLVICDPYANGLRAHLRIIDGHQVRFLITDRHLLETDVRNGTLGDFLTEKFLYPYQPLANAGYVDGLALEAKARVVKEEARDLVLEYGEMCRGLVAKPAFFGLSRMRKQARVSIPSMADYLRLMEEPVRQRNLSVLSDSFRAAISTMKDDIVGVDGDCVTLQDSAVDRWSKDRASEQVVNILRQSQRAFYSYVTKSRAIYLSLDLLARELYSPLRFGLEQELGGAQPENPRNFLYLRTSEGLISFNEKASLQEVVAKLRPNRPITISPLAGVLNEVYLVTAGKEQFVAKKFTDWDGFKWFTLNLVSFGSKVFAVSGKSRMTNEYGINRHLSKKGLRVPLVLYASVKQRILVEKYISGAPLTEFVTQTVNQSALTKNQYRLAGLLGLTLAQIHGVGVSVGDAKPENFVAKDDDIFTVDLEQAGKGGDYAWDVAELLFYIGHYSASPMPSRGLSEIVEAFKAGYLRKGDPSVLKHAAGMRYAKTFSIWTSAAIILEVSKALRGAS